MLPSITRIPWGVDEYPQRFHIFNLRTFEDYPKKIAQQNYCVLTTIKIQFWRIQICTEGFSVVADDVATYVGFMVYAGGGIL